MIVRQRWAAIAMSPRQSGSYQSTVLRFLVRQSQHWADALQVGWRNVQMTVSWGIQILLYPIYATVQTVRLAGTKVRQLLELRAAEQEVAPPEMPIEPEMPPAPAIAPLTSDTPIAQVLWMIQGFSLPIGLPVWESPPALLDAGEPLLALTETGSLATLTDATQFISVREAEAKTTQAIVFVQGIATDLATRSLVLVTNQNEILNILTPEQQAHLRQRISWEVANYWRSRRIWSAQYRLFSRLSVPHPDQWLLAAKQTWQRWCSWLQPDRAQPLPALLPDLPVQQALLAVQQFPLPAELPILLPQWGLVVKSDRAITTPTVHQGRDRAEISLKQTQTARIATPSSTHNSVRSVRPVVRGVATLLETRAIVLVSNQNEILDVLTAAQQQQLRQKIIWEVAHYQRYLQVRQETQRPLSPFHPATADSPVLPPVRAFQNLMAWMQSGAVAIATNLFSEATLVSKTKPPASPDQLSESRSPSPPTPATSNWSVIALTPMLSVAGVGGAIALNPNFDLTAPTPRSPTPQSPAAQTSITQPRQTRNIPVAAPDYIDIPATAVEYIQPLWERLLRWLDRLLLWLENAIRALLKLIGWL